MRELIGRLFFATLVLAWTAATLWAAPFAKQMEFRQPDGTRIQIWGEGDEFYALFETLDGYTIVFDQPLKAYCYARVGVDGDLESTGQIVGRASPVALGLTHRLREKPELVRKKARERYQRWDAEMGVSAQWEATKASRRAAESAARGGTVALAPPSFATLGTKVGLTLLIAGLVTYK